MTLPFLSMPCSQTPPDSPTTIAFIGRLLLPSRFSTLSASGCSCHEAQSLHVCYGLDIALSTLNSCCCLHEPKTRFPVGRLFPFPGRESHPLKAPGLPWRTETPSNTLLIVIYDLYRHRPIDEPRCHSFDHGDVALGVVVVILGVNDLVHLDIQVGR